MKDGRVRKSLLVSFWDGVFASVQFGFTDNYATPFALFLGAGNFQIGILNLVRNLFVSIAQLKSADITLAFKSRKKAIVFFVFLAALFWLPTFALPTMFRGQSIALFILLFGITAVLNNIAAPAWGSLMTEYIPFGSRGKYFGWRGMMLGTVNLVSSVLAGLILYLLTNNIYFGFLAIFAGAFVSRIVSCYFISKMYEPKIWVRREDYFSFVDFLIRLPKSNFAKFSLFISFFMFSTNIAAPFFAVYMLRDLHFNYLVFTVLTNAAVATSFLTMRYWGRLTDKYGNIKILKFTSILVPFVPVMWLISGDQTYLFFLQLFAGFTWAGFNLSSVNFVYDAATPAKRERCISYFNFMNGFGVGIGAVLGGAMAQILPAVCGYQLLTLFLVSGILRLIVSLIFIPFIREVREVKNVPARELLLDMTGTAIVNIFGKGLVRFKK